MKQRNFRAIVVEDEELAREDFIRLLRNFDSVELVGEASNLTEATSICQSQNPDIVFLDIQLANESGFDLIEHLDSKTKIIFVTAYDEHAIKAFEVGAYDYLLKPVTTERLKQALEKIISVESLSEQSGKNFSYDDSIFIKLDTKYQFIKIP